VAERLMAALLKSAESKDFVGSNPTLSATPAGQRGQHMAIDCTHLDTITADAGLWFIGQHLEAGGTLDDVGPEMTVGEGFPLGAWVATYRERGQKGELRADERAALESVPGWTW
jgi:hypothetical protein